MTDFLAALRRGSSSATLVHAASGTIIASHVESATDSPTRRRGLLGRDGLPEGHALILAPCAAVHTWFMRFPIDVVFAARDGRVLKVVECVPAWRMTAAWRAFATIELPAGTVAATGLRRGDRLTLSTASPDPKRRR